MAEPVTIRPFSREQWHQINALGQQIDRALESGQVGLTMGAEPTYISAQDRESWQWRYGALGKDKRQIAGKLLQRLQKHLAPQGSVLHYGLGKLYPGELVPRWALGCFWRVNNQPLWHASELLATDDAGHNHSAVAETFIRQLAQGLALPSQAAIAACEPEEATFPRGFVLPLLAVEHAGRIAWQSCRWTLGETSLTLVPGEAALGLRLPLNDLPQPAVVLTEACPSLAADPVGLSGQVPFAPENSIRVALTVEVRRGVLCIFMPPVASAYSYASLLAAIEATAKSLDQPVMIEGYSPPGNQGIQGFQITPDPGVLEVNIHAADDWHTLVHIHTTLDKQAIACGLTFEKYAEDGRPLGTGGGAHITIGGITPQSSPLLRRLDLIPSFITYWQQHPSLSYGFTGQFVGPTSQAPRVDEGRYDSLYELELAFAILSGEGNIPLDILDSLLSPLLRDATGNAHRTALCIDKLFPANNPRSQLGLLEFRGFEMPPQTGLRLLQMLLIRALVARFWHQPLTLPLKRWGAELRDRWLLPYYLRQDFQAVLSDLQSAGYVFAPDWFRLLWNYRFPRYGQVSLLDNPAQALEIRAALEPWPVLGNTAEGETSRPVDNSLERLQISLLGATGEVPERDALANHYAVLCNGHRIPMRSTGLPGHYIAGVRFRARSVWQHPHSSVAPHLPLVFQVIDTQQNKFTGGAVYWGSSASPSPDKASPETFEAAKKRLSRHLVPLYQGTVPAQLPSYVLHPETPLTLDLRLASCNTAQV